MFVSEYRIANKKFPTFRKDLTSTLETLEDHPETGDQIPRVAGAPIFKIRIGVKGQIGKSGGYRLVYHVDCARNVITPVALYFKPDRAKLSDAEMADRLGKFAEYIKKDQP